jgi:hypothetical protein
MLDVHPPHEAAHTWKDFFIHIATIVIGLLIAIGLEQTVEAIHHHHQVDHARELLVEEMESNRQVARQALYVIGMHQAYLFDDLPVIQRLRVHRLAPNDRIVIWHPHPLFANAVWRAINGSDAPNLLGFEELSKYGSVYNLQDEYNSSEAAGYQPLMEAGTVVYQSSADKFNFALSEKRAPAKDVYGGSGDAAARAVYEEQAPGPEKLARLTPTQVDRLETAIQDAIYVDDSLMSRCRLLQKQYETFPSK